MANGIRRGWLLIADISGYTAFMARTDLRHAQPIVDGLMKLLVESMRAPLNLVKVEGDAVFGYADDGAIDDPMAIVSRVEDLYYAFRMALVNLEVACTGAPDLDLKFALHFGEYATHRPSGTDDLAGRDVILVHRLTKNGVVAQTGQRAYLLATEPAMARLPTLSFSPHQEHYDHFGTVPLGVRDLHARFDEMQIEDPSAVSADEAVFDVCYTVPASPSIAWAWHIEGDKRARWEANAAGWNPIPDATGRIGLGAQVECHHEGGGTSTFFISGWRPFRSMTVTCPAEGIRPEFRMSYTFDEAPDGTTRVTLRVSRPRGIIGRVVGFVLKRAIDRSTRDSVPVLADLLTASPSAA